MTKSAKVITPIDLVGGAVALAAVAVTLWLTLLKPNSAAQELSLLRDRHTDMQADHSRLQREIQQNNAQWQRRQEVAEQEGTLDQKLPIERRLRIFRNLASANGWGDLQIMPLQWRSAADVAEQSFSATAVASYAEVLKFFRDFEGSPTWADISHLKITPLPKQFRDEPELCSIELTLHFSSSYHANGKT